MLQVRESAFSGILRDGLRAYPQECCGILLGTTIDGGRHVETAVTCANVRTDSAHNRYEIDPGEIVRVQREARERGLEIVGFYHSHPDHPARWSRTDLEQAHWIGYSYVITSVRKAVAKETRSFVLAGTSEEDKSFMEEDIAIE